jgi:hypothetical protein
MAQESGKEPNFVAVASQLSWHEGRQSAGLYGESREDHCINDKDRIKHNFEVLGFDPNDPKIVAAAALGAMILLDFQRSTNPNFLNEASRPQDAPLESFRPDMQPTVEAANIIHGLLQDALHPSQNT